MTDARAERGAESTWTRLRRRKVVQWGFLYVAAAWGFLQGLEYVGESFNWPQQVRQIALLALVIGLPIVLVLAWYHGDRGEQRFRGTEVVIISLLLLLGGGIFWRYERGRETDSERSAAQDTATDISPHAAVPAPDAESIAVLPFADMSPAKDQEYMSDGIAEELLNLLAQVPELRVIARTSSFSFKGKDVDIAEIARRLNVANVLEGSVRKSGDKVRITAQLVRASDSSHLWSQTYDRQLTDVFAVQDEIAGAIVQALQIKLMGGQLSREGGTQNLEAYQLYLKAMAAENDNTQSSLDLSATYLEQAVKLDPNYSVAWVALANNVGIKTDSGILPAKEGYERARSLALHALQLSPDLADAHSMLGYIYRSHDWNWEAAGIELQRALALDPTNSGALQAAGMLSYTLGRWDDADRQLRAALVRDPLNPYFIFTLGLNHYLAGRYEESAEAYTDLLKLQPDFLWTRAYLAKTLVAMNRVQEALTVVHQADEQSRLLYLPVVLYAAGRQADANDALQAQIAHMANRGAFYIAQTYAYRGDLDLALEWLERAYKQRDVSLVEITGEPLFDRLVDDPRFTEFLHKMKLPQRPKRTTAVDGT